MKAEQAYQLLKTLRNETNDKIVRLINSIPGMNQIEVMIAIRDKSQSEISLRLKKLIELKVIKSRRYGKNKRYYPVSEFENTIKQLEEIK